MNQLHKYEFFIFMFYYLSYKNLIKELYLVLKFVFLQFFFYFIFFLLFLLYHLLHTTKYKNLFNLI